MSLIHKATKESTPDSLRALAFAVMIKASFISSTFKDADVTSLMSFFHLKHSTLKKALSKALEMGLVTYVYRTDNKGVQHKDLKAVRLNKSGRLTVKFNICDSKHGRIVYINTNLKDLHTQYQNSASYQSINDIMDMLVTAKIVLLVKRHSKVIDCQLRQACRELYPTSGEKYYGQFTTISQYERLYREMQNNIPLGVINVLNSGFSIERMLSNFGACVSRYKLEKLIHQSDQKHNHLFRTWTNIAYLDQTERLAKFSWKQKEQEKVVSPIDVFKNAYGELHNKRKGHYQAYGKRFIDTDKNGKVINLHKNRGCFIFKENSNFLVMPMANTYYIQCDPFVITGRKHRRVKKSEKATAKYAITPSVECHVNVDQLPF